jgi:uncharacterized protein (TIGR00159 family)
MPNNILSIFGFLSLSLADCLDILMVGALIYLVFRWIRGSAAMSIFIAVILLFVLRVIVAALNMRLMNALLGTFIDVGVLALIVIFQPEVRHFLMRLGFRYGVDGKGKDLIGKLFGVQRQSIGGETLNEIAEACRAMSAEKIGALIVMPHSDSLNYIKETGDIVDGIVSRRLIMNIFFKNSPLHDGAMIIEGDRIVAARCTLPITQRTDIPPSLGMRHKAAIGISEETDADVVVVSEETGAISYVHGGDLTRINNINELKLKLVPQEEKA